jgi:hypothetical protein
MFDFPTSLGAIPDPASFGTGFSDLQFALVVWLGVVATLYVVLLAFSLRRSEREPVRIAHETVELREAA